jgi:hypothetical protein
MALITSFCGCQAYASISKSMVNKWLNFVVNHNASQKIPRIIQDTVTTLIRVIRSLLPNEVTSKSPSLTGFASELLIETALNHDGSPSSNIKVDNH